MVTDDQRKLLKLIVDADDAGKLPQKGYLFCSKGDDLYLLLGTGISIASLVDLEALCDEGLLHEHDPGPPIYRIPNKAREFLNTAPVRSPAPTNASETVRRAIADCEAAVQAGKPISGIDRVHTALHGYLRDECKKANIQYDQNDSCAKLLKSLRSSHPDLIGAEEPVMRILVAFGPILDTLNPIRNSTSLAHPNEPLLGNAEVKLVINAANTVMNYLLTKLH